MHNATPIHQAQLALGLSCVLIACQGNGLGAQDSNTGASGASDTGAGTGGGNASSAGGTANPGTPGDSGDGDGDETPQDTAPGGDTGEDQSTDPNSTVDCELPQYEDDLALALDQGVPVTGEILRLVGADTWMLACGDGFFASTHDAGSGATALEIPGRCRGLAYRSGAEARAVLTTSTGHVVLASLDSTTGALAQVSVVETSSESLHHVAWTPSGIRIAGGTQGILTFAVTDGELVSGEPLTEALDARGIAATGDRLLVADGRSGIRLLAADGSVLARLEREGEAQSVVLEGSHALILRGFRGFDYVRIGDDSLELLDSRPADGIVLDATLDDRFALVNLGYAIVRYALEDDGLREVSRQLRPARRELEQPWFLALARSGATIHVALGSQVVPIALGEGLPAPDLHPVRAALLMLADPGKTARAAVPFRNSGTADAIVTGWTGSEGFKASVNPDDLPPPRPGCPDQYILAPGALLNVKFEHEVADTEPAPGILSLSSDDPDEPSVPGLALINRVTPQIGDTAPELAQVTWHGETFRLGDHRGDVIFVKLISPT
ncbi:MAG: hypothetical protein V3V08_04525 [Nannocystaceae bacterium]